MITTNGSTLIIVIQLHISICLGSVFDVMVVNDIYNIMYCDTCMLYGSIFLHNSHFYLNALNCKQLLERYHFNE